MRVNDIPKRAEENPVIFDSYVKAQSVLRKVERPYCSISGGSDSDVMMDIMARLDADKIMKYVWFNTGMEYKATKKHLDFLEQKYDVKIERMPPVKPVPFCVNTYGVPFISKTVSEMWGLKRTGCVGRPYGLNISQELEVVKQYEPSMYKACMKVFGQSYEYTVEYREFQKEMKSKMG